MTAYANDSVKMVPPVGDAKLRDSADQEKWLIYCPAIASDTLLYLITQAESYSLRSYGGRLGVNATGMHAEGAHTTSEFRRMYEPRTVGEMAYLELAVHKTARWEKIVADRWADFRKAHPELQHPGAAV
jgi:hypothetical protein